MSKLMSSLVAATIVGAFSLSAIAADAAKSVPASPAAASIAVTAKAEKPGSMLDKKHVKAGAKADASTAAAPAMPGTHLKK